MSLFCTNASIFYQERFHLALINGATNCIFGRRFYGAVVLFALSQGKQSFANASMNVSAAQLFVGVISLS